MPSFLHEILVELFRRRPDLTRELLAACAGIELAGVTAELGSADLSQIAPAEYRSDAVTVFRDASRAIVAAAIVEVQLQIDPDKQRTWPLYVAGLRAALDCPVILLVFAPDDAAARWARQPIDLGHPGFCLRPIAISFAEVPRVTDAAAARAAPEAAVLAAMAHPGLETARVALDAVRELPGEVGKLYWDVVLAALPDAARQSLEAIMIKGYQYQSEFARKYVAQGREEERAEVRVELRRVAQELATAKLGPLAATVDARIAAIADVETLTALIVALGRAVDATQARAAVDQLAPSA